MGIGGSAPKAVSVTAATVAVTPSTGTTGKNSSWVATVTTTPADATGRQFEYDFVMVGESAGGMRIINSGNQATITGAPFKAGEITINCTVKDTSGKSFVATATKITVS